MRVRFAPLEALDAVVEGGVRWIQLEVLLGSYARWLPASIILVVVAMEHVVC